MPTSTPVDASPPTGYPDLVYSLHLDRFFPCKVLARGGDQCLITARVGQRLVPMRVPAGIVYRRSTPEEKHDGLAP